MKWPTLFNRFEFLRRKWARTRIDKGGFLYTFRPIYIFSRVFGALPFSIIYDANGDIQKAHVSVFDFIWFVGSIGMFIFFGYGSQQNLKLTQESMESDMLMLGNRMRLYSGLISGVIIISIDMKNRFKLIDIFKKFISFDKEVRSCNHQRGYIRF